MNKLILTTLLTLGIWACCSEKSFAQYYTTYYPPANPYVYYHGPSYYTAGYYAYPTYGYSYYYPRTYYPSAYYPAYTYPSYYRGYYRTGLLGRRNYYYSY